MRRLAYLVFLLVPLLIAGAPTHADGDRKEREELTDARKRGDILPLADILESIRPTIGTQILEVEFESEDGVYLYEIYYLDTDGRRREITVDARDGSLRGSEED